MADRRFTPPADFPNSLKALTASARSERIHGILQLTRVPNLRERRELEDLGVALLQPLGGRAWLASLPRDITPEALQGLPLRWAGPLRAEDKISGAIRDGRLDNFARRVSGRVQVLVRLFADASADQAAGEITKFGARVLRQAPAFHLLVVSVPDGTMQDIAALDSVRYIEPSLPPGQAESDRARSFMQIGPVQAAGADGGGVTVGVLEGSHAFITHPDFGNRVARGDADPASVGFHSTMMSGLIAGSGAQSAFNGGTALQWRGVAPQAQVRSYNFVDPVDNITNYLGDLQDAVQNDGVDIANNSWGDFGCTGFAYGSYAGRALDLDDIVRGGMGRPLPVVFSGGNERIGTGGATNDQTCIPNDTPPFANYTTLNHPKASKNIIAVGAVDSQNDRMTDYSSWGPTLDGRVKPEVVAAGHHNGTLDSGITILDNPFGRVDTPAGPTFGNPNQQGYRAPNDDIQNFVYAWATQTSSAAALTSGVLALLLDTWRQEFPGRPDPLPSSLKALLVHTARDLDNTTTWYNRGPDYASGYGLVRTDLAAAALRRGEAFEGQVAHAEELLYFIAVPPGAANLKITLAWDDPAAAVNADPALINDLDLVVTDPSGSRRYPWTLNPTSPAAAAIRTVEDHVNNLEQVEVDAPAAGTWAVAVRGTDVPDGPQLFSLVADNGPVRQPIDLVLALDISSSMNSAPPGGGPVATKIALLQQAVELFLETWRLHAIAGDRIGIAYFSTNVSSVPAAPPLLLDFGANVDSVVSDVQMISASGCTAMGGALQVAFDGFDPASNNKRVIILFSDGMQSINPFIGEEGTPARLKVRDYAAGAPLPFDAFRCSSSTAQAPDGTPIAPDGRFVDEQGVEIHSIGIGVSGAGFEQLIARVADEVDGVHHFTSAPDADLDLFYTNDLVQALKSNTLEIVETESDVLAGNAQRDIAFPVNDAGANVTLVLSWKGALQDGAIELSGLKANGAVAAPSKASGGRHYTVMRFDRTVTPAGFTGAWKARLVNKAGKSLPYQLSVLIEDGCLHYDFVYGGIVHEAGGRAHLTARLTEYGRPLREAKQVTVRLTAPARPLGNVLSEWLPRAERQAAKIKPISTAPWLVEFTKRLEALALVREFVEIVGQRRAREIILVDNGDKKRGDWKRGDGIYSGWLDDMAVPGNYALAWGIDSGSACGQVRRQELSSLYVHPAPLDRGKTDVRVEQSGSTVTVRVRPADRFGNLLGPGQSQAVQISAKGAAPAGSLVDLLDGSYAQTFRVPAGADPDIVISTRDIMRGAALRGRLSELIKSRE